MTQYRAFTAADASLAAAAALSRRSGAPVTIDNVRDLGGPERRNLILRATATAPDGAITRIIIKATRSAAYDPGAENVYETSGLVREWAATTLLAAQGHAALLAADLAQGVLVFADDGENLPTLVQPLLHGSATEAERALTGYAVALAHLHADTINCRDRHAQIIRDALPAATLPKPGHAWIDREPRPVLALLGGTLPDGELDLMAQRLQSPGPWQVLVHRDPCPDNVLLTEDGTARLVDFEFTGPGHALLDALYPSIGFPTCWCAGRIPDAVIDRIEHAWRAAIAPAIPQAADDRTFRQESGIMSMIWMFGALSWLLEDALKQDHDWGIAKNRSRILHYLSEAIRRSADAGILPGTRQTASAWREDLQNRWPSTEPLALYPAFRPGA